MDTQTFLKNVQCQKILVSVKFLSAILGAEWLRQFYGRLEKCVLSAEKPMSIKFLLLGGDFGFWPGGGVPILFLWARGFF